MNLRVAARPNADGCSFYLGSCGGSHFGTLVQVDAAWTYARSGERPRRRFVSADAALRDVFAAADRAEILALVQAAQDAVERTRPEIGDGFVAIADSAEAA